MTILLGCLDKKICNILQYEKRDTLYNYVGLSMMCYTEGKERRTCLGECQFRGRIGKSL